MEVSLYLLTTIRRRRPTPATLFRVAEQSSPEDDNATHQRMAQAHMQALGACPTLEDPPEGEESEEYLSLEEEDPQVLETQSELQQRPEDAAQQTQQDEESKEEKKRAE
ncbi:hypothetical protein JZ751_028433 [Albula glossodonta]|uniref:Protein phosphatase 1 regulatory subunit 1B n=1 Tax=Albula glossodonta TaxID=121402 RepID=A0A8T2NIU0_9TELE|nr:hypothetical protein JZ751_028433 [Albula glossodonta]